jgi:predicted DNA-binding mobile mystery protein A
MNIKEIVTKQYREIIDGARSKVLSLIIPPEGWLRTNRKALKLPVKVILNKARIKKSELYRIEKAELDGTLTLNKLKETANAMGCELYYAVVPRDNIDSIIEERAKRHAVKILKNANMQMQLENQATTTEQVELQVNKVTEELIKDMPEWFWEEMN